jgi:hypothetical protein
MRTRNARYSALCERVRSTASRAQIIRICTTSVLFDIDNAFAQIGGDARLI